MPLTYRLAITKYVRSVRAAWWEWACAAPTAMTLLLRPLKITLCLLSFNMPLIKSAAQDAKLSFKLTENHLTSALWEAAEWIVNLVKRKIAHWQYPPMPRIGTSSVFSWINSTVVSG